MTGTLLNRLHALPESWLLEHFRQFDANIERAKAGLAIESDHDNKMVSRAEKSFLKRGKPAVAPVGLSLEDGARYLDITPDQFRAFVKDGEIDYINVGRGKKRPRMRFTIEDLNDFIERRKRRDTACLSTGKSTRHSTISTSSSNVVGFSARRAAQLARKPKSSKR
jgi:hypothetical protein